MVKIPQSKVALERHLKEQLVFLERSADAFDAGYRDEAKRLAVTIRVLVHDNSPSVSLLTQLGKKCESFCDTAFRRYEDSLVPYAGLVAISVGNYGLTSVPHLDSDNPQDRHWVDFATWWNSVVFADKQHEMSRRDVVFGVANQDGGAHVDPSLDEVYAKLSQENALGLYVATESGMAPIGDPHLVAVRQIAHELLKTLKPGYAKKPAEKYGVVLGGTSVSFRPTAPRKS